MSKRTDLLVKAAMLFYMDGVTQTEIAKQLNISRPTVAALLQEARDNGIVRITIHHAGYSLKKQQEMIADKYGLETVLIADKNSRFGSNTKTYVGECCASFIEERLPKIKSLGLGWGTTIYEYVQHANYTNYKDLSVIPLMGGMGMSEFQYHSNHLAFVLAQKYNCAVNYFYAPAIAETLHIKKVLESTELVNLILEMGQKVDMAIVGVGNPMLSSTYRQFGYIHDQELKEIQDSNAVGDICATFFDNNCHPVNTHVSERMLGLNLENLMNIPEVVVVATGKEKVESLKALMKKPIINHLIIDNEIADLL